MAKDFAKSFYASRAWQKCRRAYIESRINIDGGLCEKCRTLPGYIVHHKIPLSPENINNPEVTLNFDNLAFDCKECHDREEVHSFVGKDGLLVYFDENGDVLGKTHSPPHSGIGVDFRMTEDPTLKKYASLAHDPLPKNYRYFRLFKNSMNCTDFAR